MAHIEVGHFGGMGVAVPRANDLAVVAAEDSVADGLSKLQRNAATVLDREIRDAAPRIELIRRHDRTRRAYVDAGLTAAAVAASGGTGCRQRQVRIDFAQQEVRAGLAVEQQGVLADPAQSGVARQGFFERWRAVRKHPVTVWFDLFADTCRQLQQTSAYGSMIVPSERVARDIALARIIQHRLRVRADRPVVHPGRDHRDRAFAQLGRPAALRRVSVHVAH